MTSKIFRRKIYDELLNWKTKYAGKYALMVEGARRVGKSTVVRQFAKKEYKSSIILDFSNIEERIKELFEKYPRDLNRFFLYLQEYTNTTLYERQSLIVFDEIQFFPLARQLIKHLVADGRYDYIETGSLISIRKNVEKILIPSEEMNINMHPMDFEEFLWACGNEHTIPFIRESFETRTPLGRSMHEKIMEDYKLYMLIGGMPQVVSEYVENNNFESVENAKQVILRLYENDSYKMTDAKDAKANSILNLIPSFLSTHEKTFSPSMLKKGSKTREYYDSIIWLKESKIVNLCYRNTDPNPALNMNLDENTFKMYMLDTGLLFTSAFISNIGDRETLYKEIIDNNMNINKGMFFENMVAQELVACGRNAIFNTFYIEGSTNKHEIDFIIAKNNKIIPIECKSGSISSKHKSLDCFMDRYSDRLDEAFVIHSKDLRSDGKITYIPIYMTMFL